MKPRVNFAMIDAKEYPVLAGDSGSGGCIGTNSEKNMRLIMRAETEYLNRLLDLQRETLDKLNGEIEDEPEERMDQDRRWEIESEENKLSRGVLKQGTGNLYYS